MSDIVDPLPSLQHTLEEDGWEDDPLPDVDGEDKKPPLNASSSVTERPRKRRALQKAIRAPSTLPKSAAFVTQRPQRIKPPRKFPTNDEIFDGVMDGTIFATKYLFDIFTTAVKLLRRPLYFIAFLWLLAIILVSVSDTLTKAFFPVCHLPFLNNFRICRHFDQTIARRDRLLKWADYPKLVDSQSSTFEQLLGESISGSGLSLGIKKAEMATADLVTLVRVSDLKSKDLLAETLTDFLRDAKKTGQDLRKLSSKVGGAVDSIMAVNDYALHAIEATLSKNTPSLLNIYGLIRWKSRQATNAIVTDTFDQVMSVMSKALERLILEAEVNLANLNDLEERLSTLHELITREDSTLELEKNEILSELWTKLGGNRKTLRNFDKHFEMLKNLGEYRKQALAHVVGALQSLQSMSSDMEDIRERVSAPELTGSKIPVEVHLKSIKSGLERLREGKIKAKRIEEEAVRRVLDIKDEE